MKKLNVSRREFLGLTIQAGIALGVGSVLSACAPAPTQAPTAPAAATSVPPTTAPAAPPQKVTLRYQRDDTPGEKTWADVLRAEFAKTHPEVTLQDEPATTDWNTKTIAALVAGTAPDVLVGWGDAFMSFAVKGAYLDLTDIAKAWGDYDQIAEAARNDFTVKGKVMSVAYCYDPCTVDYYHPSLFKKDNVPLPSDTWTYDDFKQAAIGLTHKDASGKVVQWGYNGAETISNWGWQRALAVIWSYGGRKYDANMEHCLFTQPEALEAINLLWELKTKYNASPTPEQAGKLSYYQMFASGQCAFQATGPWAVGTYKDMIKDGPFKDEWAIGAPPRGPKGRKVWGSGNSVGVNKDSQNRDLALTLVRLITGPDQASNVAKVAQRIPARTAAAGAFVQPGKPDGQDIFGKVLNDCMTEPMHPKNEAEINNILNSAWEEFMLLNKRSPKDALADAMPKVDKLLQEKS